MLIDISESKTTRELYEALNEIDSIIEEAFEEFDIRCKINNYTRLYESSIITEAEQKKSFKEWMNNLVTSIINGFRRAYDKFVNKINTMKANHLKRIEDKKKQAAANKALDDLLNEGKKTLNNDIKAVQNAVKSEDQETIKETIKEVSDDFKETLSDLNDQANDVVRVGTSDKPINTDIHSSVQHVIDNPNKKKSKNNKQRRR